MSSTERRVRQSNIFFPTRRFDKNMKGRHQRLADRRGRFWAAHVQRVSTRHWPTTRGRKPQGHPQGGDLGRTLLPSIPRLQHGSAGAMVQLNIFDKLVYEDAKRRQVHPRLATEWKFLDDLTLEMKLRKDVTFHDGGKFTAEDVLFTFQRGKANSISASTFAPLRPGQDGDRRSLHDQDQVQDPRMPPCSIPLTTGRRSIVSKAAVEKMGADAYARNPVGTGPYKLAELEIGFEISLVRNENYWGEKAMTRNVDLQDHPRGREPGHRARDRRCRRDLRRGRQRCQAGQEHEGCPYPRWAPRTDT